MNYYLQSVLKEEKSLQEEFEKSQKLFNLKEVRREKLENNSKDLIDVKTILKWIMSPLIGTFLKNIELLFFS